VLATAPTLQRTGVLEAVVYLQMVLVVVVSPPVALEAFLEKHGSIECGLVAVL
jgi:hypothetical protein